MHSNIRRSAAVAGIAAIALALSACSSGAPEETAAPGGTEGGSTSDALPSTGWRSAERDEVADGGSLTLPLDATPANWNLSNLDSGTVDDNNLALLYYAQFVRIEEDGTWAADPNYAESVELTSEDPQVVEIKVNPDAKWSDGTPIGVQDVQGQFNALNGSNPDYNPTSTNVWSDVESVEAGESDQDIIITFANKNADWPSILGNIQPSWLTATPESFNTLWANGPFAEDGTTFVSGGPFIVTSFDATAQTITFGRNPEWWGDTPKLETLNFKAADRSTVGQAFANSEFDAIGINSSVDTLESARQRAGAEILGSKGTTFSHITLNGTSGVLQDKEVRQAFAKSLNREIMAQALVEPLGVTPEVLNNLIYLQGQEGYEDDSAPIAFDLEGAKQQLEDAGWTAGDDGIREKDGQRLTVRFVIPSENPNSATLSQQIQPMAREAGFDVSIETVPSDDYFTSYVTTETRDFEATTFAWQGTAFPISSTESVYYPADSGQNFPGVTDEQLGDLWAEANADLDPASRTEKAKEIDKILTDLATVIPIFARPNQYAVSEGLVNYGPAQFETIDWTNVGFLQ